MSKHADCPLPHLNEHVVRLQMENMRLRGATVAQVLGISAPYWSLLLTGQRHPSDEHVDTLSALLRLPRPLLLGTTTLATAA